MISWIRLVATWLGLFQWEKKDLVLEVLAAESQLALCQERLESQGVRRHRFSESFRWKGGGGVESLTCASGAGELLVFVEVAFSEDLTTAR